MARTQANRHIGVSSPLGEDVLLLRTLTVREEVSRPFEIRLEMLSETPGIVFEDLIGQTLTVRSKLANDETRYFNGYVSAFRQLDPLGELARYEATLVPWLWLLSRNSDCRIFQDMSVPEIVKEVFRIRGFTDFDENLEADYKPRTYCVQYGETTFDFVSRLLEDEGIYYYFRHAEGVHTLVLSDASSRSDPFPGYEQLRFHMGEADPESGDVSRWQPRKSLRPNHVRLRDFDFSDPREDLTAGATIKREHAMAESEIYEYPGHYVDYDDGERYARLRVQELQSDYEVIRGHASARGICAGHAFEMIGHPREDQKREYLVTSNLVWARADDFGSAREARSKSEFICDFRAIDLKTPFRPRRVTIKPIMPGPQTAIVVGPEDNEIWTDQYGRVKVQFHWDRNGTKDENSSCWIRVSQPSAGRGWGSISLPRVGQEVVVDFLDGDADRPIIIGRVYNAVQRPPYDLPDNATISTTKSSTSKGGEGFNEIRFQDAEDEEEIFVHAQKDLHLRIEHNKAQKIGNDKFEDVERNKNVYVKNDRTVQIDGDDSLLVKKDVKIVGKKRVTIVAADEIKLQVGKAAIFMQKDGTIVIDGTNVLLRARDEFGYAADSIVGEARTMHDFKGAIVKHNA